MSVPECYKCGLTAADWFDHGGRRWAVRLTEVRPGVWQCQRCAPPKPAASARPAYHNTTGKSGRSLRSAERKAQGQRARVAAFFQANPGVLFTPEDVWHRVFDARIPLTSARRTVTDLTDDGLLERTEQQRTGMYGDPIYCWRLRPMPPQQATLF